ncbi:MAG TPA: HPr family phosphocarrier protein [Pseudonocardiaceae bacterium]|jgi:phosphotransferase system HPr (HPr) family protein
MSPNSDTPQLLPPADDPVQTSAAATVTLPANLHARPAGKLAQAAARFDSTIRIEYGDRIINPTGVLAVMALGAPAGATITLAAYGPDADAAVQTLADILANAE